MGQTMYDVCNVNMSLFITNIFTWNEPSYLWFTHIFNEWFSLWWKTNCDDDYIGSTLSIQPEHLDFVTSMLLLLTVTLLNLHNSNMQLVLLGHNVYSTHYLERMQWRDVGLLHSPRGRVGVAPHLQDPRGALEKGLCVDKPPGNIKMYIYIE